MQWLVCRMEERTFLLQYITNNILELVVCRAFSTCQHRSSGSSRMTCRTIWKDSWEPAMTLGKIGKSGWAGKALALGTTRHTWTTTRSCCPWLIIDTPLCIPCNFTCTMDLVLLLFTAVGDYSVCTYRGSNWHMRAISQHIFGLFDLHQQCFCYLLEGSYFSKTRFSSTSWKSSISRKGQRLCETLRHCSFLHLFFNTKYIGWYILQWTHGKCLKFRKYCELSRHLGVQACWVRYLRMVYGFLVLHMLQSYKSAISF